MGWLRYGLGLCCFTLLSPVRAESLLLISVDTLRADRLSVYGYRANRTPHIDGLAAGGVRFENAFAEVPLTLPSHSTLLTGTYPFYHQVRDNAGFVLPEEQVTLAELLKEAGYRTAAFIGSYVLASRFGTSQGFETFDESFSASAGEVISATALRRSAPDVSAAFLAWLKTRRGEKFFAWVHFYDPHAPYATGYDREVSRVDESIAQIVAALGGLDLLDSTHVFFVSDHGESLGEHGESAHGFFIYDSTLRVPWIIRPARSFVPVRKTVSEPFSLVDVLPTALQLLGLPSPPQVQGRSAVRAMLGKASLARPLYAETYLPRLQFGWAPLRSLRLGRYKFIEAPRPELYDLDGDPAENANLFEEKQALARRYQQQLQELVQKYHPGRKADVTSRIDRETAQKLAALGYVAWSAPSLREEDFGGVDPKDRIQVFEKYQQVVSDIHHHPSPAVLNDIRTIRDRAPEIKGLYYLQALGHERLGNLARAVEDYLQALQENADNSLARANLANLYVRLNRLEDAGREFAAVLAQDPNDYRSRNNRALIYRLRGMEERAQQEFEQVVAQAPHYAPGWLNLGLGLAQQGRWQEAESAFRRTIELDRESAMGHFHLARALNALGRKEEADQQMEIAVRLGAGREKQ